MDQHTAADDYFYVYEKNIFTFNSYFRVDNGFKKLVHKQMNSRPILICTVVFKLESKIWYTDFYWLCKVFYAILAFTLTPFTNPFPNCKLHIFAILKFLSI